MGINYFFDSITKNATTETELVYQILSARGFLLDLSGDGIISISDNSHRDDVSALQGILTDLDIGKIILSGRGNSLGEILVNRNCNCQSLQNLFPAAKQIKDETVSFVLDWRKFGLKTFGEKIPTMDLEPFIARHIKSISACGFQTNMSCDGNHLGENKLWFTFRGIHYTILHQAIFNKIAQKLNVCLSIPYDINRGLPHANVTIQFTAASKFKRYYELNQIAEVFYNNRILLREFKREVSGVFKNRTTAKLPEYEKIVLLTEAIASHIDKLDFKL